MKEVKKWSEKLKYGLIMIPLGLITKSVLARDLLSQALEGNVQDSLGSEATFWKIFVLAAIILATCAAAATQNHKVFLGVIAIAFIPGFLIKTFVF